MPDAVADAVVADVLVDDQVPDSGQDLVTVLLPDPGLLDQVFQPRQTGEKPYRCYVCHKYGAVKGYT